VVDPKRDAGIGFACHTWFPGMGTLFCEPEHKQIVYNTPSHRGCEYWIFAGCRLGIIFWWIWGDQDRIERGYAGSRRAGPGGDPVEEGVSGEIPRIIGGRGSD